MPWLGWRGTILLGIPGCDGRLIHIQTSYGKIEPCKGAWRSTKPPPRRSPVLSAAPRARRSPPWMRRGAIGRTAAAYTRKVLLRQGVPQTAPETACATARLPP